MWSDTNAVDKRDGIVKSAAEGSVFLDEIGDLDQNSQVKLLRLLQDGEYTPVGSDTPLKSKARFILATNQNLAELVAQGKFRQDLFYRLSTHIISIPPLRQRSGDLKLLVDYFVEQASQEYGIMKPEYDENLIASLAGHSFPGNIRELRAMVYNALIMIQGKQLMFEDFNAPSLSTVFCCSDEESWLDNAATLPTLKEASNMLINEAMKRSNNNQSQAGRILGVSPQAISKRLKEQSGDLPG